MTQVGALPASILLTTTAVHGREGSAMFEDFESALALDSATRRRYCGFGKWIRTLDEPDRVRAEELVADDAYNCRQLARYFASKGATFNDQVINRHRRSSCCGGQS